MGTLLLAALSFGLAALPLQAQKPVVSGEILVDDFEDYEHEGLPTQWKYLDANKDVVFVKDEHMRPNERFFVVEEERWDAVEGDDLREHGNILRHRVAEARVLEGEESERGERQRETRGPERAEREALPNGSNARCQVSSRMPAGL